MVKAILLDLDGTLLPMDTDQFLSHYIQSLSTYCAEHIHPQKLVSGLWEATGVMIADREAKQTNEEVFTQYFLNKTGLTKEQIWPVFEQFYLEEFPKLRGFVNTGRLARMIVQEALAQGYKVVIATNPVFPKEAIMERLRWIEVADLPVHSVTVYEESHFCKPNPDYYLEILDRLGVSAEESMMVGNDMQEDMVAGTIGMRTFLVTDYLKDKGEPRFTVNALGSLEDFYQLLKSKKLPE